MKSGVVSGAIYLDKNGNGQQEPGEPGVSGVKLTLVDAPARDVVAAEMDGVHFYQTTETNAQGLYRFTQVPFGHYVLTVIPPAGYILEGSSTIAIIVENPDPVQPTTGHNLVLRVPYLYLPSLMR
jgi:hypothetical protein